MSAVIPARGRAKLRAIENMAIPGLTRPLVRRFVTDLGMDPFNNNSAHMSKMHGIHIAHDTNLLMPIRMDEKLSDNDEWKDATLDKRVQMFEEHWAGRLLELPEFTKEHFEAEEFGYMRIDIAPQVVGRRWDSFTRAFLQAYRPSKVILLDADMDPPFEAMWWRITVQLNDVGRIEWCKQEVKVPLPKGVTCGGDLKAKVDNKL